MKFERKLIKCIRFMLCVLLCVFSLTGCTYREEDLYAQHKEYLNYTLGEHTIEKEKRNFGSKGGYTPVYGYQWTLSYSDSTGATRIFVFNNIDPFEEQLVKEAGRVIAEQAKDVLIPKYFAQYDAETLSMNITINVDKRYHINGTEMNLKQLSDPTTGLSLRSLTLEEFKNIFQYQLRVSGSTQADELAEIDEIKPNIEGFILNVILYFNDQSLTEVHMNQSYSNPRDPYSQFVVFYNRDADIFTWTTADDLRDDSSMIDGRLTQVWKVYIGNTLYKMDYSYVNKWNEQLGEYMVSIPCLGNTLDAKGILFETDDDSNHPSLYRWSMGGNTYEVNLSEYTVLKNGENIIGYKCTFDGGINASVFEEITGTVVRFDEETRALYITWDNGG